MGIFSTDITFFFFFFFFDKEYEHYFFLNEHSAGITDYQKKGILYLIHLASTSLALFFNFKKENGLKH